MQLTDEDLLITVGDYIDRGPQSKQVFDWLIERHTRGNLIPLFGNHEEMLLNSIEDAELRDNWIRFGGAEALASFQLAPDLSTDIATEIPEVYWKFLRETCVDYYETDSHFFVHASAAPSLPLAEQPSRFLRWERFESVQPHRSDKIMVCGHTPQESAHPTSRGYAICIDTGVYIQGGWLTCLDVHTGEYWQANERGAVYRNTLYPPEGAIY